MVVLFAYSIIAACYLLFKAPNKFSYFRHKMSTFYIHSFHLLLVKFSRLQTYTFFTADHLHATSLGMWEATLQSLMTEVTNYHSTSNFSAIPSQSGCCIIYFNHPMLIYYTKSNFNFFHKGHLHSLPVKNQQTTNLHRIYLELFKWYIS